ncbi:hypothetical protein A5658_03320 [Mycobacterium sp. 1245111.1]|uniref:hypothetical protein n=1 Tax=Mycobacterium sp. 1245111.1 TaxID=1834073 RepID=UPI00080051B4|nr:hypothetical protein [Mycobacterium sp. 1245111.1]OBK38563.1 hypothetical protein A5658_03320 [Mycobacterium sp. 1245111.1]
MATPEAPSTPTRAWQSLVPELPPFAHPGDPDVDDAQAVAADTAERLLLLLHYSIDWQNSWVADRRKTYWDNEFPSHVRGAANSNDSLDGWWSNASRRLTALAPRQADRRLELAILLREPAEPVITMLLDRLPALVLRVRIIAEAVAAARPEASA